MRFVLLMLIAGCAAQQQPLQWSHSRGAGREQLDVDYAQCEERALSQHPLMPVYQGMQIFASCMRARGWTAR